MSIRLDTRPITVLWSASANSSGSRCGFDPSYRYPQPAFLPYLPYTTSSSSSSFYLTLLVFPYICESTKNHLLYPVFQLSTVNMSEGSCLGRLAPELKIRIMEEMDFPSITALAMANKEFYHLYKGNEGPILYKTIASFIGPVLPKAIATYTAQHADWKPLWRPTTDDELLRHVHEFGSNYLGRTTGTVTRRGIPCQDIYC